MVAKNKKVLTRGCAALTQKKTCCGERSSKEKHSTVIASRAVMKDTDRHHLVESTVEWFGPATDFERNVCVTTSTPAKESRTAEGSQRTFQSEMINDASQKHKASQRHWVCYIARAVFQEPAGEILRSKQCISYHSTANYCKASKATHAESKRRRAEPPVIPGSYVYWGPSYARTQHRMTNHHNTLCFPSFLS